MASLFERIQGKQRSTRKVVIPLDDEAVQAAKAAEIKNRRESIIGTEGAQAAAKTELEAAQARLRETTAIVTVAALAPKEWDALQRAHPPTQAQIDEAKREYGAMASVPWNDVTFPAAAWAACQVPDADDQRMSEKECLLSLEKMTQGEQMQILGAIQEANSATISPESLGEA